MFYAQQKIKNENNETMLFLQLMKTKFGKFDSKCFNYEHFDADCIMMNEYRKNKLKTNGN